MTHRELIEKAMPLVSLNNEQWELLNEHLSKQKGALYEVLDLLLTNQSRVEVMSNYNDYYGDRLDNSY